MVSLFRDLPLAFSAHAIDADGDEGQRENLTHIEGHTAFKVYLYILGIFDKESECEDEREAKSEEETRTHTLWMLAIEPKTHEEEHEIGDGLGWRGILSTLSKINAQGTSVTLPMISEFMRLPKRIKQAVMGVAMAILSSTCHRFSRVRR